MDPELTGRPLAGLLPVIYDELRLLAGRFLERERTDHTLRPTALVHEVFLKMAGQSKVAYEGRTHVLALAAGAMRRILVDHARAHLTVKRGGGWKRVTLMDEFTLTHQPWIEALELERALGKLAELDPRSVEIVELRFYGGLTEPEIAEELGMSERWVRSQWAHARSWLRRELDGSRGPTEAV